MDEEEQRQRTMTDKGLLYAAERKRSERSKLMRRIKSQSEYLERLIESDSELTHVKIEHADWLNNYEQFLESHCEYQQLLSEEERLEDNESIEASLQKFLELKERAVSFVSRKSRLFADIDDSKSLNSLNSRSSAISKVSSMLSAALLKESQRKAELIAKTETLAEKQKLEEEKFKLQQKEEAYKLKTELKISDAKAKVIEELEKSMMEDQNVEDTMNFGADIGKQNSVPILKNKIKTEMCFPKRVELVEPKQQSEQAEQTTFGLLQVSKELNKPKAEIQKFGGNPLEYTRFVRQFNTRVSANTDSYDERLNFLLQFTYGEAHKIVAGYSNLEAKRGYKASLHEFQERYGDSDVIARAYVKKALEWPVIKQDQAKGLDEYAIFLRECLYAVESVDAIKVLEYSENLKVIIQKLPYYMHDKWRNLVYEIRFKDKTVTFEHLVEFIRKEAKKANDPVYGKEIISFSGSAKRSYKEQKEKKFNNTFATVVETDSASDGSQALVNMCLFCDGQHTLENCTYISQIVLTDRYSFLKSKGLCFACIRKGHMKVSCKNKLVCAKCKRPHPTILHVESRNGNNRDQQGATYSNNFENAASVKASSYAASTGAGVQALPVIPVRLKHKRSDKFVTTYAFLDSGSTATFCSDRILDLLGVEGKRTRINLVTIGENKMQETHEIRELEISSLNGDNTLDLPTVFTQKSLPFSKIEVATEEDIASWPHLRNISVERIDSEVDLLIGINVPKAMEPWDIIPSENCGPFAIKTIFGWVVYGPIDISDDSTSHMVRSNFIMTNPSLEDQLRDHFNRDFPERTIDDKPEPSREDRCFMDIMSKTISKENSHYVIDLPFKSKQVKMPNNRKQAEQRLAMLSKRFNKDTKFCEEYKEFMNKVINKGYAERVQTEEKSDCQTWYLPHHGVYHPKKNKIRVVFDCAARYRGISLNDQLLQGPNLTSSLIGTLIRFRQERVAIMGDIESMFYQVHVTPKHRSFQRFLWWKDGDSKNPVVEYQMKVHLFGSTSSPSCANYALRQTVLDKQGHFNEDVLNTVLRHFYVDDCLKSVQTVDKAVSMVDDLQAVLCSGGFHISKWISNDREVMSHIPASERSKEIADLDLDQDVLPVERSLGISWCTENDTFSFTVNIKNHLYSRRGILSTVSSIYDPLGFLAPLLLNAKVLLQELCQLELGWDDPIPEECKETWCKWLQDVQNLSDFQVRRCFKPLKFGPVKVVELHHFADASERGYGTVTYMRMISTENRVHCAFVIGRSRVAPLKKITVPRLELTAATVSVRTDKMLKSELDVKINRTVFWTDSMTVLRYIRNSTTRFHTFVANRLTVIHEGSLPEEWRYVSTKLNPADVASRGMLIDQARWTKQWIEAPSFLYLTEDEWPTTPKDVHVLVQDDPEIKKAVVRSIRVNQDNFKVNSDSIDQLILRHSSWYKLKRSIAWILKIRDELLRRVRCKNNFSTKPIEDENRRKVTTSDFKGAEAAIITYVQLQTFSQEMKTLEKGQTHVKKDSSIRKLDPILKDGVLRVGGRLQKSCLSAESKHPVILPREHHLTTLVIRQLHEALMHAGRNHTLAALRQHFWVVKAPSAIRKLLSKCVTCRKYKSPVGEQKMANLPEDRVTPDEPPFTRVGVDYFGPFEVKQKRSRVKRYGVIFTCLASRAVHLEVAYSLDTDSYINALRRFVARRGQVQVMRSDNGTNFVGAERELHQSICEWNCNQVEQAMLQKDIQWKFNPPTGSHHGGVWERLIRSVRSAINSTLREQVLDDEGLQTLLCEVEAILNSRPITKISDSSDDLEALTPNHLLLLAQNSNLPPGLFNKTDIYCRRRWRQVQYMANLFWQRWVKEYLPLLQERQKWHVQRRNIQVGDVVLIVDSTAPRSSWPMGIIVETIPDRTGFVRQVNVKTATNVLKRPIDKLCIILEAE